MHDLRHTYASQLLTSGADREYIREQLGHSDAQMTAHYAKYLKDNAPPTGRIAADVLAD